ncbi:SDR family NAD(P)-dependent oxidoreductase [Chrysosporum bergii ANA360D]|uniref:SDR family NAD(P)-dependent oxidoreductase n=2 Tax=Chrysosporum bergii TaxID=105352 RepID=A0AA43GQM3_9CYAN|nr:SDR family NAD(P)-dependent oxidoreductase [Chrysosporum bergii]MDH6059829.1 SDR family NAD(P)-dependent oxidoreductase [Chrysosporum bergii ANA360D]
MNLTDISSSSCFVVTGGGKGITAQCVIKLAEIYQCKFILLGRSQYPLEDFYSIVENLQDCYEEALLKRAIMDNLVKENQKPTPQKVAQIYNQIVSSREIHQTLTAIAASGGSAEYISVDITNFDQFQKIIPRLKSITGVIHGAGVLADKRIEKKTSQDFEKVYQAKVQGLENLLASIELKQLKHLILFSSVTGFYGNVGQADYAIANEILNKTAHLIRQKYPQCQTTAINWGPWDSGMVSPQIKKALADRQIDIIPVEVGTRMFINELQPCHYNNTQVVIGTPLIVPPPPISPELRTYHIYRHLELSANPFLYDHTIAGTPVLPATCAMSWIINTCEELYPGYQLLNYTDFKVLKGIVFNQNELPPYTLEITEVRKSQEEITLNTKIYSQTSTGKTYYHFSARVNLHIHIPLAPIHPDINLQPDEIITITKQDFYQNGKASLFHGPCFQQVQRVVNITTQKITTECLWSSITPQKQGQFPIRQVNPYTTDLSMHALWIWTQHFYQKGCLPGKVEKYSQYSPTPIDSPFYVTCHIQSNNSSSAVADFIIHDEAGRVYCELLNAHAVIWSN